MPLTPLTSWAEGEVLTAAALLAEFAQIYADNGTVFANPAIAAQKMGGFAIIMDGDNDSYFSAALDDRMIFVCGGTTRVLELDGATDANVNGFKLTATVTATPPTIEATGDTNTDINMVPKGTGVLAIQGVMFAAHTDAILANQTFV